jgi:uncharacterized protein YjbI with pentapeptide repeats
LSISSSFLEADLEDAYFGDANLEGVVFRHAKLLRAEFGKSDRSQAQINRRWVFEAGNVIADLSENGEDLPAN